MLTRRFFSFGAASLLAAPAIVKFDSLMPVRNPIVRVSGFTVEEIEMLSNAAIKFYLRPEYIECSSSFYEEFEAAFKVVSAPTGTCRV